LDFCGFLGFFKKPKNLGFLKATSTALAFGAVANTRTFTFTFTVSKL